MNDPQNRQSPTNASLTPADIPNPVYPPIQTRKATSSCVTYTVINPTKGEPPYAQVDIDTRNSDNKESTDYTIWVDGRCEITSITFPELLHIHAVITAAIKHSL